MKKKTNVRTMIRQIVREEVAMVIGEVVNELKQPTLSSNQVSQPKSKKKVIEGKRTYKKFTENSVLNDVLNETAQADEWKTMGGSTYTSDRVNEVATSEYGDLMNGSSPQQSVNPNDPMAEFLNKDYRSVMKKVDEKAKQKRGV
jgi:hypothetical protein